MHTSSGSSTIQLSCSMPLFIPKNGLHFTLHKRHTYRSAIGTTNHAVSVSRKQVEHFEWWNIFLGENKKDLQLKTSSSLKKKSRKVITKQNTTC